MRNAKSDIHMSRRVDGMVDVESQSNIELHLRGSHTKVIMNKHLPSFGTVQR